MTNCTGSPAEQWLEAYLQGTMPEAEAVRFEEHYFDCPVCLAQVEALQAAMRALGAQPLKARKPPIAWPVRAAALSAIAALLVMGFFATRAILHPGQSTVATGPAVSSPQPHPALQAPAPSLTSSALSNLADLALPAFQMHNLRESSGDPHFDAGMKAYRANDCTAAVKTLTRVPEQDADALNAQFYAGVCQMHMDQFAAASKALRAIAVNTDCPQQEAAIYYLAQIALARNDGAAAHRYLARTTALHGDFERRARAELAAIPADAGGK